MVGRPLADLVAPALGKTLAARGFAAADVVIAWPEIMGERLSAVSEPSALEWPRGRGREDPALGATLVMRVEPGFALEAQHLAPLILDRVNAYFGWRCVERLSIRQGPVPKRTPDERRALAPDDKCVARAKAIASSVADEDLRRSLTELGAMVLASK
jgi:hypothetical protein